MIQMTQTKVFWNFACLGVGVGVSLLTIICLLVGCDRPAETKPVIAQTQETAARTRPATTKSTDKVQAVAQMPIQNSTARSQASDTIEMLATARNQTSLAKNPWIVFTVQPDPQVERKFLLITSSEAAGRAFNCYFGFYFNEQALDGGSFPILLVDRLFQESVRQQVLSNYSYIESNLSEELEYWLEILIDHRQGASILEFIIACYQEDFANRLQTATSDQDLNWQESKSFSGLEVTYHAGRETYCTFEQT